MRGWRNPLDYWGAERAIVEIAHRLAAKEPVQQITDVRGTVFVRRSDDDTRLGCPNEVPWGRMMRMPRCSSYAASLSPPR